MRKLARFREQRVDDRVGTGRDRVEYDQAGFRADWSGSTDQFTLQGDAYEGRHQDRLVLGRIPLSATDYAGANLLARWTRRFDDGADLRLQAYVDRSRRDDPLLYRPTVVIGEVVFKHMLAPGRHRLVCGGGFR